MLERGRGRAARAAGQAGGHAASIKGHCAGPWAARTWHPAPAAIRSLWEGGGLGSLLNEERRGRGGQSQGTAERRGAPREGGGLEQRPEPARPPSLAPGCVSVPPSSCQRSPGRAALQGARASVTRMSAWGQGALRGAGTAPPLRRSGPWWGSAPVCEAAGDWAGRTRGGGSPPPEGGPRVRGFFSHLQTGAAAPFGPGGAPAASPWSSCSFLGQSAARSGPRTVTAFAGKERH